MIFQNVGKKSARNYHCAPTPERFIIDATGCLRTPGLKLSDQKVYRCTHENITGVFYLDLHVDGTPPDTPNITRVNFSSTAAELIHVEWTDVESPGKPVNHYTLFWNTTIKRDSRKRQINQRSGMMTTNTTFHMLNYSRGMIYHFYVIATNDAGNSTQSEVEIFDVEKELSILMPAPGGLDKGLQGWAIALIVLMLLLLCCICYLCCLILFCCCLLRRRKRKEYNAEEQGMKDFFVLL